MHKLREIRKLNGITANRLAKMCGVTRQHISRIEHGAVNPSVAVAKKLGRILGVNWTVFFDDCDTDKK